jgi:ubiquinone/menaquinone biosynthesis C-methylase UbiE
MDSTQRFSSRVDNYVKYRPHYPKLIIDYLKEEIGLQSSFLVADIGSGTGILTELFLQNGNKTIGIEPNEPMRFKAEELLSSYKNFLSIEGTAEQTTLEGNSIDLIVAAQAFHWFDPTATRIEFSRIAKADSAAVLIWNDRQTVSDFEKEYDEFLLKYATDYACINHKNITPEKIQNFFYPQPVKFSAFYNEQIFDLEGLKGRLLSSSYISAEENEKYFFMLKELQKLFDKYGANNTVTFIYQTQVFSGKIK